MQRMTITIDDDLLEVVDALRRRRGYDSRSEAFRDIVRDVADREKASEDDTLCVAALSYVFDYDTRDLGQRLSHTQHEHHDLVAANMRLPLDHETCMELCALRGRSDAIRAFSDEVTTQRGVRHASLHMVPVRATERHRHGPDSEPHHHFEA